MSSFFVAPPVTMTLHIQPPIVSPNELLTITATVFDRGQVVAGAATYAVISTPSGLVTIPLAYNGTIYSATLRPTDLGPNLGSTIEGGQWGIQATAEYYGSTTTTSTNVTVNVPPTGMTVTGPEAGITGLPNSFTATVTPITTTQPITYAWQATGQWSITVTTGLSSTATFTWTLPGTKAITVTTANDGGMITRTHMITIYSAVHAGFIASPLTGIAHLTVVFTNTSTGDFTNSLWHFGDGITSTLASPTHTFAAGGIFTVSLTASGLGGVDTCKKANYITIYTPVTSDFIVKPTDGITPFEVVFTNTSTGDFVNSLWHFGDGVTSTLESPTHTYSIKGTYTVSLEVNGLGGTDTRMRSNYITVYDPVRVDFTAAPTVGVAPLEVTFDNLSTGDFDTCLWNFGDGDSNNDCDDVIHIYGMGGTYTVSLTISGTGGTEVLNRATYITVYEPVKAQFSASPTSGIRPLEVEFTNLSTGDYDNCKWDLGDGDTRNSCSDFSHNYLLAGVYTVSLIISGTGGSDAEIKVEYVRVYEPVSVDFTGVPTKGIAPLEVRFINLSSGDYESCAWDFGDDTSMDNECNDPIHIYTTGGVYTVSLSVSGLGGSKTETKAAYVTVYEPVSAGFVATPTSGIAPLSVDFSNLSTGDYDTCAWAFGDGGFNNDCDDPSHDYQKAGVYTVTLTVSGLGGEDTLGLSNHITVYQPVSAGFILTPTSGIAPLMVVFTNTSTGDFTNSLWHFGDGVTSTLSSPTHTFSTKGVYSVSLTVSGFGGTDTKTFSNCMTVYQSVQAGFTAVPTSGIAPFDVVFSNISTGDFIAAYWDFGDGITSTVESPTHTYSTKGTYAVTLIISGPGGTDMLLRSGFITVYAPVMANFTAVPTTGIAPLEVDFINMSAGDYDSCEWDFGDGKSFNSCDDPTHAYNVSGIFTASLSVSGLGGSDDLTHASLITVHEPVSAMFTATPTLGLAPLTVVFTNTSTGDFESVLWGFGDDISSTLINPTHVYSTTGTFTVTLDIKGPGGEASVARRDMITVRFGVFFPIVIRDAG